MMLPPLCFTVGIFWVICSMFQTTVSWEGDKLVCVQRGEKEGRGWTHWSEGNKLHLEMRVEGIIAKQVFKKAE